jgi:hypothetical protein
MSSAIGSEGMVDGQLTVRRHSWISRANTAVWLTHGMRSVPVTDSDDCVGEVEERIDDNVAALVAALQPVAAGALETGRYYTW